MRSERYQIALIVLGIIVAIFLAVFFFRELFPEYRIYQDDYIALEEFRSQYTGETPPEFKPGVKQIVFEREDKGPAFIDRCISCHVAEQLPHFSPTKIAYDINGNMMRAADGTPEQVPNENYIWAKLDQKIAELTDVKVNEQLSKDGDAAKLNERKKEAERLQALKIAKVDGKVYDVTKVLRMHPLMGKETRPFEFHPLEDYGCTSCHSGNGRGLTTEKAHGPVFDEQYEVEFMGPKPEFTEHDERNDPKFARVFNDKPGHNLLFQTTPILVGHLIQSKCIQCHAQSSVVLQSLSNSAERLLSQRDKQASAIQLGFDNEKQALNTLLNLRQKITEEGLGKTKERIEQALKDLSLQARERTRLIAQMGFLSDIGGRKQSQKEILSQINNQIVSMLGSDQLAESIEKLFHDNAGNLDSSIDQFLQDNASNPSALGSLFVKWKALNLQQALLNHVEDTQESFKMASEDENAISSMVSDIDWLTKNYRRGQQLYMSQACYACHRIAGLARGGVGPDLTREGDSYPWFIKESMVWPQADLPTSTMPNYVMDHVELEDLMTFLLGQKGPTKAVSQTDYKIAIQEWETGGKMPWEKPIPPSKIHDLRYSMTVFATEGCSACHRLKGFESNVGFKVEKDGQASFDQLHQERQWFKNLIPEESRGSFIVKMLEEHADEIDARIVNNIRQGAILEEIEQKFPESIESLYANFRFASRAKNSLYHEMAEKAENPRQKQEALEKLKEWKERVNRVLMMYVQEYGLGRLIGPRPNWSGVYRSDEWLMEHFYNPTAHVARSIMPVMPFDETKFYALTYMLDTLGKRNRDALREVWQHQGFNPQEAYSIHCAQCHGEFLQGNGPVATWIYPIPKNLRNAEFLRNLTKQNVAQSIMHGVKGTPMPPWGETPKDKINYDGIPILTKDEIAILVDWIYSSIPGGTIIKGHEDVPKWQYYPKDVIDELKREGNELKSNTNEKKQNGVSKGADLDPELLPLLIGDNLYAALEPKVAASIEPSKDLGITEIFDVTSSPIPGDQEKAYYIKEDFYTPYNIESGKKFFDLNCAVCHGNDADGMGIRASVMVEAKPRMLTNLDWIKTRDDLRLLRSIKYGVAGTAMTPWGDLTSSLQRLQLVIYIRSLSKEKDKREELAEALYKAFDEPEVQLENARIQYYTEIDAFQKDLADLQKKQETASGKTRGQNPSIEESVALYQQQLQLKEKLHQYNSIDQVLIDIKKLMEKKRLIYQAIGNEIISTNIDDQVWANFLTMVALNNNRFAFSENELRSLDDPKKLQEIESLAKKIAGAIDEKIEGLIKEQISIKSTSSSIEKEEELHALKSRESLYLRLKMRLLSGIKESESLENQMQKLYLQYQEMQKKLSINKSSASDMNKNSF